MNIPIVSKLREARVDHDGCVVEGIILSSGLSENGTWYSTEVVESSNEVFNGVQCYADHPSTGETERSVRDIVGVIESTWFDEGSLRATIRLSRAHDWLLTMISEGLLGDLSINALGKTRVTRKDNRVVREVLEITKAFSVDFVAKAAAGGHVERILSESTGYAESLKLIENISAQELEAARPDLFEKIKAEIRDEVIGEDVECLEELGRLHDVIEKRKTLMTRSLIASELIENAGLPDESMEFLIEESRRIDASSDDEHSTQVEELIERHRKFLATISATGKIRGMGSGKNVVENSKERSTLRLMGVGRE